MSSLRRVLPLVLAAGMTVHAAQSPADRAAEPQADPVVIEFARMTIAVAADGSEVRDVTSRVRIQTAAGLQDYGTLMLPYERDLGGMTVEYVRVRKPDGRIIETPPASALDIPSEVTRFAPTYTDIITRHINVRGVSVGDVIEYAYRVNRRPLLPGHFVLEDDWWLGHAVEDGEVLLRAPESLPLKVKTHGEQPVVERRDGTQTYRWRVERPRALDRADLAALVRERQRRRPAIQATTFGSWEDLGQAVRDLWSGRAAPTPALREKAASLTAGARDDAAKVDAIYRFVAAEIRYVAISFGLARLQPNTADDVLGDGFGDCKDKHVLLEALLRAVGIEATPVLIGAGGAFDSDMPSILQFNHAISRVELAGGREMWLDATLGPAQAGYLFPTSRGRSALRIPSTGPASIVTTPADPVRPNRQFLRLEGELAEDGTLTATVEEEFTGDIEFVIRQALERLPESQRRELFASGSLGSFGGDVSGVSMTPVSDPADPLRVTYSFTQRDAGAWQQGRFRPVLMRFGLPDATADSTDDGPIEVSEPLRTIASLRIRLPSGFAASIDGAPRADGSEILDEAEYRWRMAIEGDVLTAERDLAILRKEWAADRREAFAAFRKVAMSDVPMVTVREAWPWRAETSPVLTLGDGKHQDATRLVAQAASSRPAAAVTLLRRAIELEPEHPAAWSLLGARQIELGQVNEGLESLRRQIQVAATPQAYKRLALALRDHWELASVPTVLREGIERFPDDRDLHALLGEALLNVGRAGEAVPVLEQEAERRPKSSRLQSALGRAYLQTGNTDRGVAALRQSVALEPVGDILAMAARELEAAGHDLDTALDYAERAVNISNERTAAAVLAQLPVGKSAWTWRMGFYMETLGRVLVKRGAFDRAEPFCRAAWELAFRSGAAACLADVAETKRDAAAAATYRQHAAFPRTDYLPLGAVPPVRSIRPPADANEAALRVEARLAETRLRTVVVPRPRDGNSTGQFEVLTGPDGRVREARVSQAPAGLEPVIGSLLGQKLGPVLPENGTARLLRRVDVVCMSTTGVTCDAIVHPE